MGFEVAYTVDALPRLLEGAVITVKISAAALFVSIPLATLMTIMRTSGSRPVSALIGIYISFIRGTPLLVQIFLIFYVLPAIGLDLSAVTAGILALGLNSAAFTTEIMRGGLSSIPKGQVEAAQALGMATPAIWRKVVLPQMFQAIVPPLVNEFSMVIKLTPLVSVITVVEMMRVAQQIYNVNFRPLEVLVGAAAVYFVIIFSLSRLALLIERRNAAKFA